MRPSHAHPALGQPRFCPHPPHPWLRWAPLALPVSSPTFCADAAARFSQLVSLKRRSANLRPQRPLSTTSFWESPQIHTTSNLKPSTTSDRPATRTERELLGAVELADDRVGRRSLGREPARAPHAHALPLELAIDAHRRSAAAPEGPRAPDHGPPRSPRDELSSRGSRSPDVPTRCLDRSRPANSVKTPPAATT